MINFSLEYKSDALAVLKAISDELEYCFDFIDHKASERMENTLSNIPVDKKTVPLDERWFYIISNAINLLDEQESTKYDSLKQYIHKLNGNSSDLS